MSEIHMNLEKTKYSFHEFQALPVIVKEALVRGIKDNLSEQGMVEYVIDRYDQNQTQTVGRLATRVSDFHRDETLKRMVHCYVDYGCNDLAAKLAWHEDYDVSV